MESDIRVTQKKVSQRVKAAPTRAVKHGALATALLIKLQVFFGRKGGVPSG